ncbi:MAG: SCO family protein [Crocinitomicaceae bacterium]|nr:SCO family protein [Crocinitomicaceae bacterium]MDG1657305.1 SCO family protein [Crocinitomicaceae bacterium]
MRWIVGLLVVFVIGITVSYFIIEPNVERLPIINPVDLEEEMVDPEMLRIGMGHKIGNFAFKNQNNELITQKEIEGKVFVAEYFFTTCGTICPKMNEQMKRVQFAYSSNEEVKILSFTVDPEIDTVEQMKRYAIGHGAQDGQWHFLTGSKAKLYEVARKSFFMLKPAEAQNLGDAGSDFIHTNNFVLVDRQKRIRGYYDGTSKVEVTTLIEDIQRVLDEKE